jgi:hypothetical protein
MKKPPAINAILFFALTAIQFSICGQVKTNLNTETPERIRIIVETDAGGDPDDEQSLVRFLLYMNEWDVEGIIANRPRSRDGENLNPERTGLGIVRNMIKAYEACYPNLVRHDPRYPTSQEIWTRTVPGYEEKEDGVNLIIAAVDNPDPRPVWFSNWGTDHGSAESSLKRALDKILKERGPEGYAKFKSRLRLSSSDKFGDHTWRIDPPFPLWIDPMQPEIDKKRWYHQFSVIAAKAGGFDIENDVRNDHGPLGALYPLNTNRPQKEGDTMTFLYFLPAGFSNPSDPTWGSWAGRHGLQENANGRNYYWANQQDTWEHSTSRENTLLRWASDLQNDFKARMDWCVNSVSEANHAPVVHVSETRSVVKSGETIVIDASKSFDRDGETLEIFPVFYPEPGTYRGDHPPVETLDHLKVRFKAPTVTKAETLHLLLIVKDHNTLPLCGYKRIVFTVEPN